MEKNFGNEAKIIDRYFSTIYLTLIALLQSVAIAFLVQNFVSVLIETGFNFNHVFWRRYLFSLIIIFTVWHHYMYGILYTKWFPNFWDSCLPFSLGVFEIFMVALSSHPPVKYWFLSSFGVCISGSLIYLNSVLKIKPELFTNIMEKAESQKHCKNMRFLLSCSALSTFLLSLIFLNLFLFDQMDVLINFAIYWILIQILLYEFYHRIVKQYFEQSLHQFKGA